MSKGSRGSRGVQTRTDYSQIKYQRDDRLANMPDAFVRCRAEKRHDLPELWEAVGRFTGTGLSMEFDRTCRRCESIAHDEINARTGELVKQRHYTYSAGYLLARPEDGSYNEPITMASARVEVIARVRQRMQAQAEAA